MRYEVYYSDIWNEGENSIVNEWIYLREEEREETYSKEEIMNLFTEEDLDMYDIDDIEEGIIYIEREGIAILKLEKKMN